MNVIYKSRANGEFAVVYYVYAHWLLNEGNSSKRGFHGTHGTPSRSATANASVPIKVGMQDNWTAITKTGHF